jgi:hypothetical protein
MAALSDFCNRFHAFGGLKAEKSSDGALAKKNLFGLLQCPGVCGI